MSLSTIVKQTFRELEDLHAKEAGARFGCLPMLAQKLDSATSSFAFFPTLSVGFLDFRLNSSPRPELFSSPGLVLAHP